MVNQKDKLYELRYEVASERRIVPGFTLIPAADPVAEVQHISEHENIKRIQRLAINGDSEAVKEMLKEFPSFKREDLKQMLKKSAAERGKELEF